MKPSQWSLVDYQLQGVEQGEGPPALLLVHGSLCDWRYWSAQIPKLADGFRVLAPSLRRCWPEVWDGEGEGFSTEQHVADLIEFIERQGEAVHLLGHSRGGNIALRIAILRPDLVRSLLLADPGGEYEAGLYVAAGLVAPAAPLERNVFREEALQMIRAGDVEGGMQHFVDTVSGAGIWQRSSARFRHMAIDNAFTLAGQVHDQPPPLSAGELAQVRCRVLLIGGERSPQPFPQVLEMLGIMLPDARVERIPGVSHGMNLQRPAHFNRLVSEFIASCG